MTISLARRCLISAFFFLNFCFSADAGLVHPTWTFIDFGSTALTNKIIYITPIARFGTDGTNVVTSDRLKYTNDSSGTLTVSNMVNGYAYKVEFNGPFGLTAFSNTFGTNITGSVNAIDYPYVALTPLASTVAFSQTQSDTRYIRATNGAGGSTTLSNVTLKGTTAAVNGYVWTATGTTGLGRWLVSSGGGGGTDTNEINDVVQTNKQDIARLVATNTLQAASNLLYNAMAPTNRVRLVYNVLNYGADPTGAADSTVAFSNAAVAVNASGGMFYMPKGNYNITNTINFTGPTLGGNFLPTTLNGLLEVVGEGAVKVQVTNFHGAAMKFTTMRNVKTWGFTLVGPTNVSTIETIGILLHGPSGGISIGNNIFGFKIGLLGYDITDFTLMRGAWLGSNYIGLATTKLADSWMVDGRFQANTFGIWVGYTNTAYTIAGECRGFRVSALLGHNTTGIMLGAGTMNLHDTYFEGNTTCVQVGYDYTAPSQTNYTLVAPKLYLNNCDLQGGAGIDLYYYCTVGLEGSIIFYGGTNTAAITAKNGYGNVVTLEADGAFDYINTSGVIRRLGRGFYYDPTALGFMVATNVSLYEFGYLDGVTSAIQTQFSNKQPLDSALTTLAALADGSGYLQNDGAGVFSWAAGGGSGVTSVTVVNEDANAPTNKVIAAISGTALSVTNRNGTNIVIPIANVTGQGQSNALFNSKISTNGWNANQFSYTSGLNIKSGAIISNSVHQITGAPNFQNFLTNTAGGLGLDLDADTSPGFHFYGDVYFHSPMQGNGQGITNIPISGVPLQVTTNTSFASRLLALEAGAVTLPLAQSDVTGLTNALSRKTQFFSWQVSNAATTNGVYAGLFGYGLLASVNIASSLPITVTITNVTTGWLASQPLGAGTNLTTTLITNSVATSFAFTAVGDAALTSTNSGTQSFSVPANVRISFRFQLNAGTGFQWPYINGKLTWTE